MGEFDLELTWGSALRRHESSYRLRLDPWIEARALTIRQLQFLLNPATIRHSLFPVRLDKSMGSLPPPWLSSRPAEPASPPAPEGEGCPEMQELGEAPDILKSILRVLAVDRAITRLRALVTEEVMRDWRRLYTGERVATVSAVAVIGAGALAGMTGDDETRRFALNRLAGFDIPVHYIPGLRFNLDIAGPDKKIVFTLDVNSLVRSIRR